MNIAHQDRLRQLIARAPIEETGAAFAEALVASSGLSLLLIGKNDQHVGMIGAQNGGCKEQRGTAKGIVNVSMHGPSLPVNDGWVMIDDTCSLWKVIDRRLEENVAAVVLGHNLSRCQDS